MNQNKVYKGLTATRHDSLFFFVCDPLKEIGEEIWEQQIHLKMWNIFKH